MLSRAAAEIRQEAVLAARRTAERNQLLGALGETDRVLTALEELNLREREDLPDQLRAACLRALLPAFEPTPVDVASVPAAMEAIYRAQSCLLGRLRPDGADFDDDELI